MMQYVLETNALTKQYKNFTALNGLTMHIPKVLYMDLWEEMEQERLL